MPCPRRRLISLSTTALWQNHSRKDSFDYLFCASVSFNTIGVGEFIYLDLDYFFSITAGEFEKVEDSIVCPANLNFWAFVKVQSNSRTSSLGLFRCWQRQFSNLGPMWQNTSGPRAGPKCPNLLQVRSLARMGRSQQKWRALPPPARQSSHGSKTWGHGLCSK